MYVKHMKAVFSEIDIDKLGEITMEELSKFIEDDSTDLRGYFKALDLNPSDATALLKLLDLDNSGSINITSFVMAAYD
jgi:Ca2+-binding EF-hand superfamily protein